VPPVQPALAARAFGAAVALVLQAVVAVEAWAAAEALAFAAGEPEQHVAAAVWAEDWVSFEIALKADEKTAQKG
jgi:hypothetical protein